MGKRKKYQLKFNSENKLELLCESNIFYDILVYCNRFVNPDQLKACSVWMGEKVLE